uniref:Uncharacterized protein n=1 Tax=Ananas comosus var. bracteatus TaxID=296719 RepID=A0A6V7QCI5_ANACO|nr:unnamed protein product [Ananas comosus var. bracteatus]
MGREAEARAFAGREEDWRRERRRLLLEAARLRSRVKELQGEEKKKTTRSNVQEEGEAVVVVEGEKRMRELEEEQRQLRQRQEQLVMVERMKEEQRRREEAVEKWKQLYLAIKAELDDLIQRTHHQGERFCWGAAEQQQGVIEALQRELKARDETVETLRLRYHQWRKRG